MHLTKWANEGVLPPEECKQVENTDIGVKWKPCKGGPACIAFFYLGILSQLFLQEPQFSLLERENGGIGLVGIKGVNAEKSLALFVMVVVLFKLHVSGMLQHLVFSVHVRPPLCTLILVSHTAQKLSQCLVG